MEKLLTKTTLRRADAYMVMSETEEREIVNLLGECLIKRFYLPVFNLLNKNPDISKHNVRQALGLSDTDYVLLFFGYVREYKGLSVLLEAYPEIIKSIPDTVLIVAGEFNTSEKDDYIRQINEASRYGGKIITVGDYVPDADVEKYFTACDVVVLPYISATQSAVVPTAYMFERPVITTDVGGLPEVVIDGETGYIVPPKDNSALARAVIKFNEHMEEPRFSENIREEVKKYSWDKLVDSIGETHAELHDKQ
jgi:glycosyltransferase involved in cell wall biosynthesis